MSWSAYELLDIINEDPCSISCVGYAKTRGRRCWNRIAQHNIQAARAILDSLPSARLQDDDLRDELCRLAGCILCRAYHQPQRDEVADQWYNIVVRRCGSQTKSTRGQPSVNNGSSANAEDDTARIAALAEDLRRLQQEMEDLLNKQGGRQRSTRHDYGGGASSSSARQASDSKSPEGRRDTRTSGSSGRASGDGGNDQRRRKSSQRDGNGSSRAANSAHSSRDSQHDQEHERRRCDRETRRRDEQERRQTEEAEAAERRREQESGERADRERRQREQAEAAQQQQEQGARDRADRERRRREQAEAARRRREQEARERAESERREWAESWDRYERDWVNMRRIDTSTLDEDLLESLPWPVKDGRWQNVTERNVEAFMRHAPDNAVDNRVRFVRVLRRHALRWHEDRVTRCFAGVNEHAEAMRLITLVMQVINKLMAGART